ncbi:MAG TPA: Ppx/GppA phosphatase family protein [Trebonia sp.]|jgi:exopolyphosphatase/guanosine-5'-triphosphate,3'-diphosphate pyrophosphatase|nr:Ppx/GppA phosphatase family protein [Trebonia sp.]
MRRVAAIDCGTNSLRLLVADIDPGRGTLNDVDRRMEIVRLGQGVDRTGRLAPEALERTFAALRQYAEIISATAAQAVRMVATSATRDAENAGEFVDGVRAILGLEPEVISGGEEAALSFAGATAELPGSGIAAPYLVLDVGGGSTEFVIGRGADASTTVGAAISVDIGSVRLTERHLHGDPPEAAEVAAATADIDAALDVVADKTGAASAASLVGLAGSITTVAAIALGLPEYDPAAVHHSRHTAAAVHAVTEKLLGSSRAERAKIGSLHPGRVDVIGAGALILDRVMSRFGFAEVVVSEHDILDGIAWRLAAPVADTAAEAPGEVLSAAPHAGGTMAGRESTGGAGRRGTPGNEAGR